MTIYNKYKLGIYLNVENALIHNKIIKENATKINYIFNYSKKLVRTFIYFYFILYFYMPFSFLTFKGNPTFRLKLDCIVLLILENNWFDSFYKFDY